MNHWLLVSQPKKWEVAVIHGVWGLPAKYETEWARIEPGDITIYYATKPMTGIIGYGKVNAAKRNASPLWPKEVTAKRSLWIEFEMMHYFIRELWKTRRMAMTLSVPQRAIQPLSAEGAREIMEDLPALLKESQQEVDLKDWTQGDPRARTGSQVIYVHMNIDYDSENAFWIQEARRKRK